MKLKIPCKESILLGAAIAGTVICITVQCITLFYINIMIKTIQTNEPIATDVVNASAEQTQTIANDAIYKLYECGGKIGIYDAKSDIIVDIIDIYASTLPKSDRAALKKGIEIYSFTELSKIIDDFST